MLANWYVKSVSMAIPIVIFYITVAIVIMVHLQEPWDMVVGSRVMVGSRGMVGSWCMVRCG